MAQLIKLSDYISRYESNIYQYPSQYIRLKKENWKKIHHLYNQGLLENQNDQGEDEDLQPKRGLKRFFRKDNHEYEEGKETVGLSEDKKPKTMFELKQYFLNGLFPFQLKWASTTLQEKSFVDRSYHFDDRLKYYLQRFPDTYFVMYQPIVEIKKARMEAETILIGPLGIEIIYYLDIPGATVVHPSSDHSWYIEKQGIGSKILNPLHALKRSETFVKSVLQTYGIDFPYRKVVLAPDLTIKDGHEPYLTDFIGKEEYANWLHRKRTDASPLKHVQLKATESLLKHSHTTAIKRPEWDVEEELME